MAMNFIMAATAGVFILFFSCLRLLWKRLILVYQWNKLSKEKNDTLEWFSNPFLSAFLEGVGGSGLSRRKKKIWHYD